MLPSIAEAVGGRVPVLADGAVSRGTDVIKMLALGASAVMVGRPLLYALTLGGQRGVEVRRDEEPAWRRCKLQRGRWRRRSEKL